MATVIVKLKGVGKVYKTRFNGKDGYDLYSNFPITGTGKKIFPIEKYNLNFLKCPHCKHEIVNLPDKTYHVLTFFKRGSFTVNERFVLSEKCHQETGDPNSYSEWGRRCGCDKQSFNWTPVSRTITELHPPIK